MKFSIDNFVVKIYSEEDKNEFIDIFMNKELCKNMSGGAYDKKTDAENLFNHLLKLNTYENSQSRSFGIFLYDRLIGHFEINKNSFTRENELEIVFLLIKEYWGKGLMLEIIKEIKSFYKEKFVARVQFNNHNSIKMLEKIVVNEKTIVHFDHEKVFKFTI